MRTDSPPVEDLDELDEADLEDAPLSPTRHETPPPPPLPTRRDLNEPADPDLSDVFAAISPKKANEKVPLPPGVKERKRALLVTAPMSRRMPEAGETTVAIPPPPRVPTIAGPALPPPPSMTPPPVSVRMRAQYASSLSAIAIDRGAHAQMRSAPPRVAGLPSTTPWTAIAFAAAAGVIAITGAGFAFGFSRASARSESASRAAEPRVYDTAAVTSLDTTSASDKADETDDKPAPKPLVFGTLRFSDAPPGALVDGAPRKITGGALVLTCGPHRIKRPGHPTQVVSVPCNGSTTL